jgi:acyl-coenzyme A synthetase/AMP-(fatty) acid ligase
MTDRPEQESEHVHPLLPSAVQQLFRRQGYWGDLTLAKIVEAWAQRDPQRTAVTGERRLSYEELWDKARRVAGFLQDSGLRSGDFLLAVMPNSWQGVVLEVAASIGALCFTPRSAQISPTLALNLIGQLRVNGVVLHAGLLEKPEWRAAVSDMRTRLGGGFLMIQGEIGDLGGDHLSFEVAAEAGPLVDRVEFSPCQPCLVLSTGGTMGQPKSILHCSETLVYAATQFSRALDFSERDVHVALAPYGHAGGSVFEMYAPMLHGASILPIARWQAESAAKLIERWSGSVFITMGTHVYDMLTLEPEDRKRLRSVRVITSGAGPDALFEQGERELGFEIVRVYGCSECPGHAIGRLDDPAEVRLTQDGVPFPGMEYRILDPATGEPVPEGQTGEYECRGPNLFMGYAGSPELTAEAVTSDGFYRSGDLAAVSEEGYVTWKGRTKDIIRRGGLQIDPLEMEDMLTKHPKVAMAVVVGEPHARLGERAVIVAVPALVGEPPTLEELCDFLLAQGLQKQNLPERLVLTDSIPRTEIGKYHRAEIKRLVADQLVGHHG